MLQKIELNMKLLRIILVLPSALYIKLLTLRNKILRIKMAPRVRVFVTNSDYILLSRNMGDLKHWNCQGGGIDNGESALECAVRETREELGIDVANEHFKCLGVLPADDDCGFDRICYGLDISLPAHKNLIIKPNIEIYKAEWVDISRMRDSDKVLSNTVKGYLKKFDKESSMLSDKW